MKNKNPLWLCYIVCSSLLYMAVPSNTMAQNWSVNFSIGTTTGNTNFSYNQTPDPLTEVFPAMSPVDVGCTYQWQQSTSPVFTTYSNASGNSTSATYTFSGPLAQTTWFRLVVTNSGSSIYSSILKINDVSANWENINYIREHDVITAGITANWTAVDQLPIGQKLQVTSYVDGLGRSLENISARTATPATGTTTWGDMVQFAQYDAYGRQPLKYLPYTTTTTPGKYKATALNDEAQYYSTAYGETSAFDSITYDKSPLNRVVNIKEPGTSWAAGPGNSAAYDMNTAAENVQMFSTDYIPGDAPVDNGPYPANSLYKTTTTDENGKQVIQYMDIAGRVILTKTQISSSPTAAHSGWICIYSVFDDFGLLRCQIQPGAVSYLDANGWSFAGINGQQVFNEMCFQYNYDDKGRMIWKKAPGTQPMQTLYDIRDRIVFTQDGNQAALSTPQWTATFYDMLDRVTTTVLYNTSETVASLQTDIANATSSTVFTNPISSANLSNSTVTTILKYLYYDNYSYTGAKAFSTNFDNNNAYNPTGNPNVIPIANSARTLGEPTGSMVRILGTATFLETSDYYDEKGRRIQTVEDNLLQGQDITTYQYHWDGRLLSTSRKHTATGSGYTAFPILTSNKYDTIGRVTGIQKQFGSNPLKTVVSYAYDDMGRLSVKTLDSGYTGSGKTNMESLAYSYNIHGQLIGINKNYALKSGTYSKWANFFGVYLGYDNKDGAFAAKQLDGHIAGQIWNTQGDDAQRKYDYTYDATGRLVNAAYNEQQQPGNGWAHSSMDFSVTGSSGQITYDLNGNLLNMIQKGVLPGTATPVQVDNLTYTYQSYSNKLSYVTDAGTGGTANGQQGDFKDGTNAAGTPDYVYDANGNLVVDLNKAIGSITGGTSTSGITYNYLDKPAQVVIAGKGTVNIAYDADGTRLQKTFTPTSGAAITTSYVSEFVYQSTSAAPGVNTLLYITFEEGRIRVITPTSQNNGYDALAIGGNITLPNSTQGVVDFFIRDYQSNVRMILTEEAHTGSNICTMETSRASAEDPIFQGSGGEVENTRVAITSIPGQTTGGGWHSNTSASVSQLGDYTGAYKMGANALLKVMAGDTINATTQYYYQAAGSYTAGAAGLTQGVITSLINAITGGSAAGTVVKSASGNIQTTLAANTPFGVITDPGTGGTANTAAPQAYLTVMFFDERFNYVGTNSQWQQVSQAGDGASPLVLANLQAPKNGYAFVYVSNKSTQPVYFDNLNVGLRHSRIIEEDHYYSYGLKIASISSNIIAATQEGYVTNKNLYNDKKLDDDGSLNWYDYGFRNYDPQIAKFVQVDPMTDYLPCLSPYHYAYNEPVGNTDFDGLFGIPICPWSSAITVFFEKLGYLVSEVAQVSAPIERVFSITAHIGSDVGLVTNVINTNNLINKQLTEEVGSPTLKTGNTNQPTPKQPPIFWEEKNFPEIEMIDWAYATFGAPAYQVRRFDPRYPNVKFLVFHRLGKNNPNNLNTRDQNNKAAMKSNKGNLADDLSSRDIHRHEVPYASTEEGGSGAITLPASKDQNVGHGNALRDFYRRYNIPTGGEFWVPVPDRPQYNFDPAILPIPLTIPQPLQMPLPKRIPEPEPEQEPEPEPEPVVD